MTPELRRKLDERNAAIAAEEARIAGPARKFENLVGERYLSCRFDNFEAKSKAMRDVRDACQAIGENVAVELDAGRSVVLAGPVGTGKDHLMAAMLREVVKAARDCQRINGSDLAGQCRDIIGGHTSESEFLQRWASLDLLALSDPDGTKEKATDYYADWLYRIVDYRYRLRKSVWITINASSGREIAERIGERTWDRIQHEATIIRTDWQTHRKALRVVNPAAPKDGKAAS
jgi:DNA replication protein DnaC